MSKLKIKNATLFVTVLSACLGLLAAGASGSVNQTASSVLSEFTSATSVKLVYARASKQTLKLTRAYASNAQVFTSQGKTEAPQVLYQNSNPFIATNQTIIVTHMPRASLDKERA